MRTCPGGFPSFPNLSPLGWKRETKWRVQAGALIDRQEPERSADSQPQAARSDVQVQKPEAFAAGVTRDGLM